MNWSRKKEVDITRLGPRLKNQVEAKAEFETMLELLKDAEKYDSIGEKNISNMILDNLCVFIKKHKENDRT